MVTQLRRRAPSLFALVVLVAVACGPGAAPTPTKAPAGGAVATATPARVAVATSTPTLAAVASPTRVFVSPGQTPGLTPTPLTRQAPRGRYVVALGAIQFRPDPHQALTGAQRTLGLAGWEGLTGRTAEGQLIPRLARSWTVAPDGLRYDFVLREGVKYHNGSSFVAEDVGFSLDRSLRPEIRLYVAPEIRRSYSRTEVVAPNRVAVHMKSAYAPMLDRMYNFLYVVPKAYLEQVGDQGFLDAPIGSGPFKWVDIVLDQRMTMEANEAHWDPDRVPRVKTVVYISIPDPTTQVAALLTGEADLITSLLANQAKQIESRPGFKVAPVKGGSASHLYFTFPPEPADTPFHDVRVRRAIAYAIDQKLIVEKIYFGYATPAASPLLPHTLGFDPTMPPGKYDPELSKRLLAEAGYASGIETTLSSTVGTKTLVEAITVYLNAVGIKVKLNMYDNIYTGLASRKVPCCLANITFGGGALFEPTGLSSFFHRDGTWTYLWFEDMNALWEKTGTETDDAKRAEVARQLSRYFQEKAVAVSMPTYDVLYAFGPRIKAFDPGMGQYPINRLEYIIPAD